MQNATGSTTEAGPHRERGFTSPRSIRAARAEPAAFFRVGKKQR